MRLVFAVVAAALLAAEPALSGEVAALCFTPGEDCAALIVREIDAARREVVVQAYSFTNREIGRALVEAKRRGVDVRVVLDKEQTDDMRRGAQYLADQGVPVLVDGAHAAAHNKVMVIDGHRTVTGSFNFTRAAQIRNAENVVVIEGADVASRFAANVAAHVRHAEALGR